MFDEQVIFELGVGELLLWLMIIFNVLFDVDVDCCGFIEVLGDLLFWLELVQLVFVEVEDQDWECVWMDQFQLMLFGWWLWIYLWNIELLVGNDFVVV